MGGCRPLTGQAMKPAYWYMTGVMTLVFFIYMSAIQYVRGYQLDYVYHNHDEMTDLLHNISRTYPNFAELYSVGKSVQGRDLWVLAVTRFPKQEVILKPQVKYVANMHGNEALGRELLVHLVMHLIDNYQHDSYVRWLVDNTKIHFMPSMNPDGFEIASEGFCSGVQGRYNARGYDLNRNFPDYFKVNDKEMQPETKATREWLDSNHFILSGNIHGGALVASYPFDNTPNSIFQSYSTSSLTPDTDVFQHLALVYSTNHESMHRGIPCRDGGLEFPNGTTNGAAWYPLTGGMQDYNYIWTGCMEVTFEISCCKYPFRGELARYWRANSKSLLRFIAEVHRGVKGLITDHKNIPIAKVTLKIKGRDIGFRTTKNGEYWRILLPGTYTMEAYKDGFLPTETQFQVTGTGVTVHNFTMYPARLVSADSHEGTTEEWDVPFTESGAASGYDVVDRTRSTVNGQPSLDSSASSAPFPFTNPILPKRPQHTRFPDETTVYARSSDTSSSPRSQVYYYSQGFGYNYQTAGSSPSGVVRYSHKTRSDHETEELQPGQKAYTKSGASAVVKSAAASLVTLCAFGSLRPC